MGRPGRAEGHRLVAAGERRGEGARPQLLVQIERRVVVGRATSGAVVQELHALRALLRVELPHRVHVDDLPVPLPLGVPGHPVARVDVLGRTVHAEVPGAAVPGHWLHGRGLEAIGVALWLRQLRFRADELKFDERVLPALNDDGLRFVGIDPTGLRFREPDEALSLVADPEEGRKHVFIAFAVPRDTSALQAAHLRLATQVTHHVGPQRDAQFQSAQSGAVRPGDQGDGGDCEAVVLHPRGPFGCDASLAEVGFT